MYYQKLFDHICNLAIQQNKKQLKTLIKQNTNLSLNCKSFTPLMKLAYKGLDEAVDFLLGEFQLEPNHAILGYALGANKVKVEAFLKIGACPTHAAKGYVMSNNLQEAYALIDRGAVPGKIVFNLAQKGYVEEVWKYYRKFPSETLLHNAICGYASAGNDSEVKELSRLCLKNWRRHAVKGYAMGGHITRVNEYLLNASLQERMMFEKAAIRGYIFGEHFEFLQAINTANSEIIVAALYAFAFKGYNESVKKLFLSHPSADQYLIASISGYAAGGHHFETLNCLEKVPEFDKLAAEHAAMSNHTCLLNKIIETYDYKESIGGGISGFIRGEEYNSFSQYLPHSQFQQYRLEIIEGFWKLENDPLCSLCQASTYIESEAHQKFLNQCIRKSNNLLPAFFSTEEEIPDNDIQSSSRCFIL